MLSFLFMRKVRSYDSYDTTDSAMTVQKKLSCPNSLQTSFNYTNSYYFADVFVITNSKQNSWLAEACTHTLHGDKKKKKMYIRSRRNRCSSLTVTMSALCASPCFSPKKEEEVVKNYSVALLIWPPCLCPLKQSASPPHLLRC